MIRLTESKLLQSATLGLRVEEENDDELECDPGAVDGHEFPTDGVKGVRVHVLREEETSLAEDLLDSKTAVTLAVRPELEEVGYVMREKWSVMVSIFDEARFDLGRWGDQ